LPANRGDDAVPRLVADIVTVFEPFYDRLPSAALGTAQTMSLTTVAFLPLLPCEHSRRKNYAPPMGSIDSKHLLDSIF
jgi:hypothetical protein